MDPEVIADLRKNIRRIEREVQRQLKDGSTCCGVSLTQCHVLVELGSAADMTIADLAMLLRLDKSTLSRTVDGLVRAGLVDRAIHPDDRRFMQIRLTRQGRRVSDAIDSGCNQLCMKLLGAIPPEKHAVVIEALGLFADAVDTVRDAESAAACFCTPSVGETSS